MKKNTETNPYQTYDYIVKAPNKDVKTPPVKECPACNGGKK